MARSLRVTFAAASVKVTLMPLPCCPEIFVRALLPPCATCRVAVESVLWEPRVSLAHSLLGVCWTQTSAPSPALQGSLLAGCGFNEAPRCCRNSSNGSVLTFRYCLYWDWSRHLYWEFAAMITILIFSHAIFFLFLLLERPPIKSYERVITLIFFVCYRAVCARV